jgi:hypothetical protein
MILKERPKTCTISYDDFKGVNKKEDLGPKRSRIFLHEYDHILGLDLYKTGVIHGYKKLSELKNNFVLNRFIDEEREKGYLM